MFIIAKRSGAHSARCVCWTFSSPQYSPPSPDTNQSTSRPNHWSYYMGQSEGGLCVSIDPSRGSRLIGFEFGEERVVYLYTLLVLGTFG